MTALAWAAFVVFLLVGCQVVDAVSDWARRRRRLRRLRTTSVVRPRCVPSPGRRAASFPRRGAVHTHGRRP